MGVQHLGEVGLKQEIALLWRAIRRISKATLQNASIGRAGIRVYDGGWIRIEDGGLSVTGTADVSGYLNVSGELNVTGDLTGDGDFDWTGTLTQAGASTFTGPTTFTGQMTVNGPWKLVGNGQITGDVSLTGDFTVLPGGKIQVGSMVIDPADGGSVTFPGGAEITGGDGGGVMIRAGSTHVSVNSVSARMVRAGVGITIDALGIALTSVEPISGTGTYPGTLIRDAFGRFRQSDGS